MYTQIIIYHYILLRLYYVHSIYQYIYIIIFSSLGGLAQVTRGAQLRDLWNRDRWEAMGSHGMPWWMLVVHPSGPRKWVITSVNWIKLGDLSPIIKDGEYDHIYNTIYIYNIYI
jgi:hypothetical protein